MPAQSARTVQGRAAGTRAVGTSVAVRDAEKEARTGRSGTRTVSLVSVRDSEAFGRRRVVHVGARIAPSAGTVRPEHVYTHTPIHLRLVVLFGKHQHDVMLPAWCSHTLIHMLIHPPAHLRLAVLCGQHDHDDDVVLRLQVVLRHVLHQLHLLRAAGAVHIVHDAWGMREGRELLCEAGSKRG